MGMINFVMCNEEIDSAVKQHRCHYEINDCINKSNINQVGQFAEECKY